MLDSDYAALVKEITNLLSKIHPSTLKEYLDTKDGDTDNDNMKNFLISKFPNLANKIWDLPKKLNKMFDLNVSFQIENKKKEFAEPNHYTVFGIDDSDNSNEAIDLNNRSADNDPSLDKIDPNFLNFEDL